MEKKKWPGYDTFKDFQKRLFASLNVQFLINTSKII